ncbi:MAG TPA: TetR/AcrR family transcriptional regulator [Roseiarcus sp.]|jgi:AcrR family transcriptional regulator
MSLAQVPSERGSESDRRDIIIAAAERAFVRHGFHAATMHQVAEEAGMSAGNLYRYFSSKEALVEGLCEAGHRERSAAFAALIGSDDLLATLAKVMREHLLARPRDSAMLFVEMNAEAAHNPRIAAMTLAIDAGVLDGLARLVEVAKQRGEAAASLDPAFAARVVFTLVGGLMKRRALEPDFDIEREQAMTLGVLKALFAGAIAPASSLSEAS